jgi:hypothetical protein
MKIWSRVLTRPKTKTDCADKASSNLLNRLADLYAEILFRSLKIISKTLLCVSNYYYFILSPYKFLCFVLNPLKHF